MSEKKHKSKPAKAAPIPQIPQGLLPQRTPVPADATIVRKSRVLPAPTAQQAGLYRAYKTMEKDAVTHTAVKDNSIRSLIPLPANATGVAMKKVFKSNEMNDESFKQEDKAVIYKMLANARRRTGALHGDTEYEDWKGTMTDDEYQQLQNVVHGKINPVLGTALGVVSPGFRMATTLGRVTYGFNPFDNRAVVTDDYDFKNTYTQDSAGKLKKDYMQGRTDPYGKVRKGFAEEDQNMTPEEKRAYHVTLRVEPTDTLSLADRFFGRRASKRSTTP